MRTEKLSSARHCVAMRCQPSSQTPPCLVGMEASNGAHCWAKLLSAFGHEVRLISPQFVTPYVKSNKNDRDLAKYVFEVHGVDAHGKIVVRKTLRRNAVSTFFANSTLPRRYGSLERRSLLGKAALDAWAAQQSEEIGRSEAIRRLVEIGLGSAKVARRGRIAKLAAVQIDRLTDPAAPAEEQASRKRRLLKGPEEFREVRVDRKRK